MTIFNPLVFLDKAEDWNNIVNITKNAQLQGEYSYLSIPEFDLGMETLDEFIVVLVTINYRKSKWVYGGELKQVFDSAIVNDVRYLQKSLKINVPELIYLKKITPSRFGLIYSPPKWFRDVTIQIWEYTGETLNLGENALFKIESAVNNNAVNIDFTEVINKIDSLEEKVDYVIENPMSNNGSGIRLNLNSDGRLEYDDANDELQVLARLSDLEGLSNDNPDLLLKSILQEEKTFYVRTSTNFGNSGETIEDAFASIEEALIVLSAKYEIANHLILDLEGSYTLNCWYLPQFTGSGKITFTGNDCTITFVKYEQSTQAYFSNWSGLNIALENINFVKGECTKLLFEGGKLEFNNVDFGQLNVEFDNCRSSSLSFCEGDVNNSKFAAIRSTLSLTNCTFIAEFKYCQLELVNCFFQRAFIIEASNVILRNPRINFRWYTITSSIINSTIEFKASWLTFENPGGDPQRKPLMSFQNCNLKDFPSNIDVQGQRTFSDTSIIKLINSFTPEQFNNVNYNLSRHTFVNGAAAIELVNTAILKDLNVQGSTIKRDAFSVLGGKNYDNSQTKIPANTLQEAIDYLHQLINSQ